jgi:putative thiamine transport system substrate-binding protein
MWALLLIACSAFAGKPALDVKDFASVREAARGQTVYFNAWGGSPTINDYIAWVGREVERQFGISLVHVKLTDTSVAVTRVLAEKAAGRNTDGSVDLIWINGEHFAALKQHGLLFGPYAEQLPNFSLTDADRNPAVREDFTVPVEGFESPWSKAQLSFYFDSDAVSQPPRSIAQILVWAGQHPGRFTYPLPPDFLGTTFLKQALIELAQERAALYRPLDEKQFDDITAPLWQYLDELNPNLWRQGRAFPANGSALRQLLADSELDIGFSFDPAEAPAAVMQGELPDSVRSFMLDGGTLGNISFVAIPFNARHKAGAMVVADFLLSPQAQAHKQDPGVWGSATVLSLERLSPVDRVRFAGNVPVAGLTPQEFRPVLPEPHPSWVAAINREWLRRYGGR